MCCLITEVAPFPTLQLILLGSRNVGKTLVGNTIFGSIEQEDGTRTACSVVRRGFVNNTEITLVDMPGWWKGFPVFDTAEVIKEEVMGSMFLCPGPHVFVLVIDADSSFNETHLEAVTTHMELHGERVWTHTIIVFTRGDWLGTHTIEEYVEGEGEALQSLVDLCGNRYHVLNNKNENDDTQVTELLEKITLMGAANGEDCFVPDDKIRLNIEEKRRRVEERALLRQRKVTDRRQSFNDMLQYKLRQLRRKHHRCCISTNLKSYIRHAGQIVPLLHKCICSQETNLLFLLLNQHSSYTNHHQYLLIISIVNATCYLYQANNV